MLYALNNFATDLTNIYTKDETYDRETIEKIAAETINPAPTTVFYNSPESIPIQSGMQIVFYASSAGTMTITMGKTTYTNTLESINDSRWILQIQNYDDSGSIILST